MRPMQSYQALPEFYDAEYHDNPMLQEDVPFLLSRLPQRPCRILEIAVGTARAAIPLAQAGHRVVGIDNDAAMLRLARQKRDAVGLDDEHLPLVRQDALKLKLPQRFDWAIILFNTFLNFITLKDQDALLSRVSAHLRRGGRLWLDIFNPNLDLLAAGRAADLDPILFYVPSLDRTVQRLTDVRVDLANQLQRITFHYHWFQDEGELRRARIRFQLTWLFPRELRLLLERHGFVLEQLFGNHDGSAVSAGSPRLIAQCRKR